MECNVHLGVGKALVVEILLRDQLDAVDYILGNLITFHQIEAFLQVVALAFFHTDVIDLRNTGLGTQGEENPRLVADSLFEAELSLLEQIVTHEALGGVCNVGAGYCHTLTDLEAGISEDDLVIVVGRALYPYAGDLVGTGHG